MTTQSVFLDPPPDFHGLDPDLPIRFYHRHLPHWRQEGATYFATFRLADSIPREKLSAIKRWRKIWQRANAESPSQQAWEQLACQITRKCELWLNEGHGASVFSDRELATEMSKSLLHFQNERCFTSCFVVMPNHVHVVMKPLPGFELEDVLASVKRFVGNTVNSQRNRSGKLWEEESYDQIVRDEEHLFKIVQYIGRNPGRAGIPREQWFRWMHPDWERAGWRFRDET
jgi:REP element-mobilizing transposase RayT